MKLIVHAGTHKTATTSFQRLCYNNFENLIASRVLYPKYRNWKQHSYLAWQFQRQNQPVISDFFHEVKNAIEAFGCEKAILSGEDFENSLIDHTMANNLENTARLAGFNEIEWVFVRRQPSQYLQAIYGELSKQNIYGSVVLEVGVMARCLSVMAISLARLKTITTNLYSIFKNLFLNSNQKLTQRLQ